METHEMIQQDTGSSFIPHKVISLPFDQFEIKVKVGTNNEFLGIIAVGVRKDFLTIQQRSKSRGYHDVTDLYEL